MADLRTSSKQELACVLADDQDQLLNASELDALASVASGVVYIDPQLRRDREEWS
jgi:hypothetical protein